MIEMLGGVFLVGSGVDTSFFGINDGWSVSIMYVGEGFWHGKHN